MLVITGEEDVPYEMFGGSISKRWDIATTHEEADNIIVQQAMDVASKRIQSVIVLSDDTDVFLLLLHYYFIENIKVQVLMESPIQCRTVIDIGASVSKHEHIISDVLSAHALSGCDTTASCFGIGKGKVLKALNDGHSLSLLGDPSAELSEVIQQASQFMTACYGQAKCSSTTEARLRVWASKMGKCSQMPKLCSLPPTDESFQENVKRAQLQTCVWKCALEHNPPAMDPSEYGYFKDVDSKCLLPTTIPDNVALAPAEIMKLIKCSCESNLPCRGNRCGCTNAKLACTMFCSCHSIGCCNDLTHTAQVVDDEDDDLPEN